MAMPRNILKFYFVRIFSSMMFFLPVFVLFMQDNGLSLTEILVLEAIYAVVMIILQVPTGAFADSFGRRRSIQISTALLIGGAVVFGLSSTFIGFLIAEIIWACASAFYFGSEEAFVYDTLKEVKKERKYKKIRGKIVTFESISSALSFFVGGFIAVVSMRLTFHIAAVFYVIAFLITLTLEEPKITEKFTFEKYKKKMKSSIKFVSTHKKMRLLMFYSVVLYAFGLAAFYFYQPYMKFVGIPLVQFGTLFATFALVSSVGAFYAHKIERKIGETNTMYLLPVLAGLPLIFMGLTTAAVGVIFIYFTYFAWGYARPVISDYKNKLTYSDKRATVMSVFGMGELIFRSALLPFIGVFADAYSIFSALAVSGVCIVVGCSVLAVMLHLSK